MDEHLVWHGYLLSHHEDFTVIQSPFTLNGARVFGADSDPTTLAVAALMHRMGVESVTRVSVPEGMDGETLTAACDVEVVTEDDLDDCPWDLMLSDEAVVVLAKQGAEVTVPQLDVSVPVVHDEHDALEQAWAKELHHQHVSQGAFVSEAAYIEGAKARLAMRGQQNGDSIVWPPRYGDRNNSEVTGMKPTGRVMSWTVLSAAGAPSEFALRAPLLGGLSTVLLQLDDGPNGVFLLVDDEDHNVTMGASVELVLRRLYAQEGYMRYGLKGRLV